MGGGGGAGPPPTSQYIPFNEIQTMFSQLAKRSARALPTDLCTDHAHYVKTIGRNKNMAVEGGTVSQYYILVICKFIDLMSLYRHSVWFSFSVKQLPSAEFGICNIWRRIADKKRQRVELSSSVLLQTLEKLKSLQGTELSVVVVIWILYEDSVEF